MFYKDVVYSTLVFPLLIPTHTSLIGLSTLAASYEPYCMQLIKSKKIPCATFSLVCEACLATGVVMEACKHRYTSQPPWASAGKYGLIKSLLEDNPEVYQREIAGFVKAEDPDDIYCFPHDDVLKALCSRVELPESVSEVFVGIDPASGSNPAKGLKSHYTICAVVKPLTIVDFMAFDANKGSRFVEDQIVKFLTALRSIPQLKDSHLVFGVEAGTGMEAERIETLIMTNFVYVTPMSHFTYKKGLSMTDENKEKMVINLSNAFRMGMVQVAKGFKDKERDMKLMREELLRFRVWKEVPDKPHKPMSISYHGKDKGKTDDLAVALCWAAFILNQYLSTVKKRR